jgi:hypothetical protein
VRVQGSASSETRFPSAFSSNERRPGVSIRVLGSLAILAALALTAPAGAAERSCFVTQNFRGWKAPDDRTIYIRVGVNSFYRLDLANRCSALHAIDPFLVTRWRGSNFVCSPLDWDLRVSRGTGMPGEACIVKAMTRLSADEAAAIPRKFKP